MRLSPRLAVRTNIGLCGTSGLAFRLVQAVLGVGYGWRPLGTCNTVALGFLSTHPMVLSTGWRTKAEDSAPRTRPGVTAQVKYISDEVMGVVVVRRQLVIGIALRRYQFILS